MLPSGSREIILDNMQDKDGKHMEEAKVVAIKLR